MMKTQALKLLLALAIGAAGGWLLGGASRPSAPEGSQSSRSAVSAPNVERARIPAEVAARVRPVLWAGDEEGQLRAAIELAYDLPVDEIERWLDAHYLDTPSSWVDEVFAEVLRGRLLEADPERLVNRSLRKQLRWKAYYAGLWARQDPEAVRRFLDATHPGHAWTLSVGLGSALARTRPEEALAEFERRIGIDRLFGFGRGALPELARSHREALIEHLDGWPPQLQELARNEISKAMLASDFAAGLAWLKEQPQGLELLTQAVNSAREAQASLPAHFAELPPEWREHLLGHATGGLVRHDPGWWLRATAEELGASEEQMAKLRASAVAALRAHSEHREAALAAAADQSIPRELRRDLISGLLQRWNREDRGGAEAWLASLGDAELTDDLRSRLNNPPYQHLRQYDPGEIVQGLGSEARADGTVFDPLSHSLYWTANQLAEARRTFAELRGAAQDRAAQRIANFDMSSAALALRGDALRHLLGDPPGLSERTPGQEHKLMQDVCETAAAWAAMDPRAAAAWVESLPPGERSDWAARNLVMTWGRMAPEEAERWIGSLPANVDREPLREMLPE